MRRGGDGSSDPWGPVDKIKVQLDTNVLVLPVHVRWFFHPDAEAGGRRTPLSESIMRSWFDEGVDPMESLGARETINASLTYDGIADLWRSDIKMGALNPNDDWFTDHPWAQCGIQFRLESARSVEDKKLAERGFSFDECELDGGREGPNPCSADESNIRVHHDRAESTEEHPGLCVYVTGRIYDCARGTSDFVKGVACRPSRCGESIDDSRSFTALSARELSFDGLVAHELGHLLSLGHVYTPSTRSDVSCDGDLDSSTIGAVDNLMNPGGEALHSALLTEDQCEAARESALHYLDGWGLL